MAAQIDTEQVWREVEGETFAVVGMVTAEGEARTAGIVYQVRDRQLLFATDREAWKTRHIRRNPRVSVTVTIAKRIPFLPWIRIPAATITFQGDAEVLEGAAIPEGLIEALLRGLALDAESLDRTCVIAVRPRGDFLTYGVGVSLAGMRRPEDAMGRAPV